MNISVTHSDGRHESYNDRGTFGTLLQLRRERKQREARAAREARLVELERDIKALEAWHHAWRLEHDEDYRALHPGEWCEWHSGPSTGCRWSCTAKSLHRSRRELRRLEREDAIEAWGYGPIRHVSRELGCAEPALTLEERQRATRRVVQWAGEQFGNGMRNEDA